MTDPIIQLLGVERSFAGAPPFLALKNVSLRVDAGDYVALVGKSGAGKSTMLNILGLMDRPTSGEYLLDGTTTSARTENQRAELRARTIGFVFQGFHLLPSRTALDNVLLATAYSTVPRRDREERARDSLNRMGLGHRVDAYPATMSGGERQRVAIARAIVTSPKLLLADEPTGNLDNQRANEVMGLFESLNDGGLTVVLITHDLTLAARARRIVRISDGELSES